VAHGSPPAGGELDLDADHDGEMPLRFHTLQNIDLVGPALRLIQQELKADLLVVNIEELASFQEAQAHECWRRAILEEMTVIEANTTWKLVEAPVGIWSIGLKCVFKMKRDAAGNVTKYKARLVA
jgi:hypothetical protein